MIRPREAGVIAVTSVLHTHLVRLGHQVHWCLQIPSTLTSVPAIKEVLSTLMRYLMEAKVVNHIARWLSHNRSYKTATPLMSKSERKAGSESYLTSLDVMVTTKLQHLNMRPM